MWHWKLEYLLLEIQLCQQLFMMFSLSFSLFKPLEKLILSQFSRGAYTRGYLSPYFCIKCHFWLRSHQTIKSDSLKPPLRATQRGNRTAGQLKETTDLFWQSISQSVGREQSRRTWHGRIAVVHLILQGSGHLQGFLIFFPPHGYIVTWMGISYSQALLVLIGWGPAWLGFCWNLKIVCLVGRIQLTDLRETVV